MESLSLNTTINEILKELKEIKTLLKEKKVYNTITKNYYKIKK
jgi:hypothetical protein